MSEIQAATESRTGFIDPAALMRIRSLQLRAKAIVEGFYNGLHRSPYFGFSVEFSEYRPYVLGDDLRNLDWKLFARSDRYYIKRFEDETSRRCYFVVDQSRSMDYSSIGYAKADYARTVAATLAYFLTLQRDSVGLVTFDEQVRDYLPARHRPGHLHRMMMLLEQPTSGKQTDLPKPLEHLAAIVKKRGLVVLISDLLAPVDQLAKSLGYLRSRGHEVLILRVLDPGEISLSITESVLLRDLESGQQIFVDPHTVRASYQQKFAEHEEALQKICLELSISLTRLVTDQPLEHALLELIAQQNRLPRSKTMRNAGVFSPGAGGGS
jgi:uncharacterized protein (DUF58 family)